MLKKPFARSRMFIAGLCLAFSTLMGFSRLSAEELKPFFTLKLTGAENLLAVSEKISELAGASDEFADAIGPYKSLKGFNAQGPLVFVLRSDGEELKEPVLYLPIENLDDVELPGFDMIKAQLKKDGEGTYLLNSPFGVFAVRKVKGYHVVTPQASKSAVPDDPAAWIAGMEKHAIAFKLDFENTNLESIEMFLAPVLMLASMQGGAEVAQVIESLNEQLDLCCKEIRSMIVGIAFDPKSADLAIETTIVPQKDSNNEKQIAFLKRARSPFGGFAGGKDVVFAYNGAEFVSESAAETAINTLEAFFEGIIEQVEENAEEDSDVELAQSIVDSARALLEKTLAKKECYASASLDAEGVFLAAMTVGDTQELEKIGIAVLDRFKKKYDEADVDDFMKQNLKKEYAMIAGYKVSSLRLPVAEIASEFGCPADLKDLTLSLHWAFKDGEAAALAIGPDIEKTEAAMKKALEATGNPAALKQPLGFLALQPLASLLEKFEIGKSDENAAKVVKLLTDAGSNAKIAFSNDSNQGALNVRLSMDGKTVGVLAELIKMFAANLPQGDGGLDRSQIRDF